MKASELIEKLQNIVDNYQTLYVMGCFGAPLTGNRVSQYCKNNSYNMQATRTKMIQDAANKNPPVYGFDCVCLIKGVLWGWCGDASKDYGGAVYKSGYVPDIGADGMIQQCSERSTDFTNIVPGEAVWLKGHIGIYIGDGKVIECSPKFKNCVQVTACLNIGAIPGINGRKWSEHGKLPYIVYDDPETVKSQADEAIDKLSGLGVIQSPDYWKKAVADGTMMYLDRLLIGVAEYITKAGPPCTTVEAGN